MLASYTFNQYPHTPNAFDIGLPNLRLLEGETIEAEGYAPVLLMEQHQIRLRYFQWGFIPSWSRDTRMGKNRCTATANNIFQRPSFQDAIRYRRCLIPADSFHLTRDILLGSTTYQFSLPQEDMFCFAGIYDSWQSPNGEMVNSFAIITTEAPHALSQMNRHMPLILPRQQEKAWLNPNTNLNHIARLLQQPTKAHQLKIETLSTEYNGEEMIREWAA